MPDEPVQIVLDDTLAADDASQIRALLADQYSELEILPPANSVLQADLFQILPVAAVAIAVVNLVLTVIKYTHDYSKDNKTDIASFTSALETELAKMGLVGGKIISIGNFASLVKGDNSSCRVSVSFENTGKTIALLVRKDGKKLHFSGDTSHSL